MTRADPKIAGFGVPLIRLEELGSTNDLARVCAVAGLPEGTTVVARRQTQGRGRHGRPWASPQGGLWCSIVLRPVSGSPWGRLSLALAVAVAEAVETTAGARAAIRWPNDVMVGERKVAGILLETGGDAVIAGVGINANVRQEALPVELRATAGSLHELTGYTIALESLLAHLLARGARWYAAWTGGDPEVVSAWEARDATRGRHVVVHSEGTSLEGIADGLDPDGALRLRLTGGDVRRILAGDLRPVGPALHGRLGS